MSNKPKKWPSYALASLENSLVTLHEIDDLLREVQTQIAKDKRIEAVILAGDIRSRVQDVTGRLARAKSGDYENGDYA